MNLRYMALILSFSAVACQPALSQGSMESQGGDSGASGVVDGSDVYQFLNSGPVIDTTRMEEASRKFDRMIKLPPRNRPAHSWGEQIDRESAIRNDIDPQTIDERVRYKQPKGTAGGDHYSDNGPPVSGSQYNRGQYENGGQYTGAQYNGGQYSDAQYDGGPNYGRHQGGRHYAGPQYAGQPQSTDPNAPNYLPIKKGGFFHGLDNAFVGTAEVLGFPVADEFLPGTVDAKLAGDLPAGPDPRVYVHTETQRQLAERQRLQEAAEDRQPPSVMLNEVDAVNENIPQR